MIFRLLKRAWDQLKLQCKSSTLAMTRLSSSSSQTLFSLSTEVPDLMLRVTCLPYHQCRQRGEMRAEVPFWGCPCPPLLLAPVQGGGCSPGMPWLDAAGKGQPLSSTIHFISLGSLFSFLSLANHLTFLCLTDCEIGVTILCT